MPRDPRAHRPAAPQPRPAPMPGWPGPIGSPAEHRPGESPAWGWLCGPDGDVAAVVERVEVSARVEALAVSARWTVRLRNTSAQQLEALYLFPLPAGYAVVGAVATFGEHRVRAELAEREAARALFDAAVAAGHRVGLLEADRSEVFTLTLGRLAPGEHPEITIDLVGSLDVDAGVGSWRAPLVVAPRYSPAGEAVLGPHAVGTTLDPDRSRVQAPRTGDPSQHIPVGISLFWHGPAAGEHSCSAPGATWTSTPDGRQLTWEGLADRDVVVQAPVAGGIEQARIFPRPGGGQVVRIDVVGDAPVASARPHPGRDLVVLLDRSGSMGGWKMAAARRLAARLVDALSAGDRVAVIGFDDALLRSDPTLVAADAPNRRRIARFVESIEANGGTELAAAIAEGCRLLHDATAPGQGPAFGPGSGTSAGDVPERDRVLVLLTDAQVSDEAHSTATLAALLGDAQVYVVGIDEAVNAGLCRALASVGGGRFELVTQLEGLAAALDKVVARVARPVVRGVRCIIEGAGVGVPRVPADLFDAAVTTLWVPLPEAIPDGMVEVVGTTPSGPWRRRFAVVASAEPEAQSALWAAAELHALEDAFDRGDEAARSAAISLSLAAGVLCRHTAFVAVDHVGQRLAGPLGSVVQPLAQPAGWHTPALLAASTMAAPAPRSAMAAPQIASRKVAGGRSRRLGAERTVDATPLAAPLAVPSGPGAEGSGGPGGLGAGLVKRIRTVLAAVAAESTDAALLHVEELLDDLATLSVPVRLVDAVRALREALQRGEGATPVAVAAEALEALLVASSPPAS